MENCHLEIKYASFIQHASLQWNNYIIMLHYMLTFHLEIIKAKEMTSFCMYIPIIPRTIILYICLNFPISGKLFGLINAK